MAATLINLTHTNSANNSAPYGCSETWQIPRTQPRDLPPGAAPGSVRVTLRRL